MACCIFHFEH